MRTIIYALILFISLPTFAQDNKNTIVVMGEVEKEVLAESYTIIITLQDVTVYEGQGEMVVTPLDIVQQNFTKKLKDLGIDFNRFKRNTYYEFAMSYSQGKAAACYYLKTSDQVEVRKIIQLKSAGMSIANIDMEPVKFTDSQLVDLSIKAITNAKEKAQAIAEKMNKSIGEIVSISDPNTSLQYVQSYGTTTKQTHNVTVSFELK
ncbi:SIMPL domain-containing protein [uncultured Formosa sp.]|uniref:SIMPL domain-containing protein n=1 Tax=uncultured Formosa sp. TaxID=255435 RepID=UPI00260960E1|nr:SIMPL domain-containing protein [uncultured Formosa sp.]